MRIPTARTSKRIGAHMVEFALVIPVFFLFLFGLVEIGRGLMVSSLVTNGARTGCRVGVLPGKTTSDVTAAVDSIMQSQGISGHTTTVQVNGTTANVSTAMGTDLITVTVSVSASSTSWMPGLSYLTNNISGQFTMPHE